MENRSHALVAGLFTILFIVALIAVAFWFRGNSKKEDAYLLVSKSTVTGLNVQASVRYRGLEVGKVETIDFDPVQTRLMLIRISVKRGTPVTRGSFAQLAYQGLTGIAFVQLDDDQTNPAPLPTSHEHPAQIPVKPSMFEDVGSAGQALIARVSELTGRLSRVVDDDNIKHIKGVLANVENVTARLITLEAKLEPSLDALPGTMSDIRTTFKHADSMVLEINTLATKLKHTTESLDRTMASFEKLGKSGEVLGDEVVGNTLPKVNRILDDLSRTTHSLDRLVTDLERRRGSLIFGKPNPHPGPGEENFSPSK